METCVPIVVGMMEGILKNDILCFLHSPHIRKNIIPLFFINFVSLTTLTMFHVHAVEEIWMVFGYKQETVYFFMRSICCDDT